MKNLLPYSLRRGKRAPAVPDISRAQERLRQAAWPGFIFVAILYLLSENFRAFVNPYQLLAGAAVAGLGIYLVVVLFPYDRSFLARAASLVGAGVVLVGGTMFMDAISEAAAVKTELTGQCERLQIQMLSDQDADKAAGAAAAYQALRCWPQKSGFDPAN